MFQKTKTIARAAAESVGFAPSVPDAQAAAEKHRGALIAAQASVTSADEELNAAHDRGAEPGELTRLEAALVAKRLEVERCERRLEAAERRLEAATVAQQSGDKVKGRARLEEIVAEREQAADVIAKSLKSLGAAVARLDKADERLAHLQSEGHVSSNISRGHGFGPGPTRARLRVEFDELLVGPVANRPQPFAEWVAYMNGTAKI